MNSPGDNPHRRYNPLIGEWVLVSPHRTKRPWLGQVEETEADKRSDYDAQCYLCPGNTRVSGKTNPHYTGTHVFANDFPALLPKSGVDRPDDFDILQRWQPVEGTSRVICYSARHDLTLPQLSIDEIKDVIQTWKTQSIELSKDYKWVQIFENKGEIMGASNPHPHGQIWAGNFVPTQLEKEDINQQNYLNDHKQPLLTDYLERELNDDKRIVYKNESWVALVPFWAVWPYESMLLPRTKISKMSDLNDNLISDLADMLKKVLTKYDHLFNVSLPYSMGWHGAPKGAGDAECWILHAHIYPPLLRSATIKKFLVGYEMLAESQRDITPETAAKRLAALPDSYS